MNYLKRNDVKIANSELLSVSHSDEKKTLTFYINSKEMVTYAKNAKKIKNRVVFHRDPINFSDWFIAVYAKIMQEIIEAK